MQVKHIPVQSVNSFSKRDKNYLLNYKDFEPFLAHDFEYQALNNAITHRQSYSIDRGLLHEVIQEQYNDVESSDKTLSHIQNLKENNCFTVTTAHQPSLMTGPLYYVFKILSTINLCQRLSIDYPSQKFAPVFVIGGEDHDFEEINHLYLFGKKIEWSRESKGPVGRLDTSGLADIITQVRNILGESHSANELISKIESATKAAKTYGEFAFKISHILFDHLGLIILRMDNRKFKSAFSNVISEEIFKSPSKNLVETEQKKLEQKGYKAQAHVRDINFFYLSQNGRNRIERSENGFSIVDTDKTFSESEMITEIKNHPDRFSPNVVMRPLYQETILPNLAYIGGGGELAYWMERKTQFQHFNLPFPMLIRRNSAMIVSKKQVSQLDQLGFTIEDSFKDELQLIQNYIEKSDNPNFNLTEAHLEIESVFSKIEAITKSIDSTLIKTVQSELSKSKKSIDYIQSKLKKSIKQKEEVQLNRIKKIKQKLFPSGLQERHDNIFEYLSKHGASLIDDMLNHCDPFDKRFLVFVV